MGVGKKEDILLVENSGINYVLLLNGVQTQRNYIFKALEELLLTQKSLFSETLLLSRKSTRASEMAGRVKALTASLRV